LIKLQQANHFFAHDKMPRAVGIWEPQGMQECFTHVCILIGCNKLHMIIMCIWWQHKVHLLLSILALSVLHGIMKRNLKVFRSQAWNQFYYLI
jgi:hypothetical protein